MILPSLTKMERLIWDASLDGATQKVIARRVDRSVTTVKIHFNAIFEKVQVNNRYELLILQHRDLKGQVYNVEPPKPECVICGAPLEDEHLNRRYCSDICRAKSAKAA